MGLRSGLTRTTFLGSLLVLAACAGRQLKPHFAVVPRNPTYRLKLPDSQQIPFPDVLRAYNGFEPGKGWIDLRPLMDLRIENAYYKEGASRRGLEGFLGTEVARYAVADRGLKLLSVQPMNDRPPSDKPVNDLIAKPQTTFKAYRLYYEIVFARSTHSHGSVLLGADSKDALDRLSSALDNPEAVCYPGALNCVVFPEACSVSVDIEIVVNRKRQAVVWGTVLSSIVSNPRHLAMKRFYAGHLVPVRMRSDDPKILLLPLLPGDQIDWN